MEVTVRGRNVDVNERLRTATQEKIGRLSRHHDGWDQAEVKYFEERNPSISDKEVCEATLRGHGRIVRAKAASADALTSLDKVVDKLEHQIDKLKSRRTHQKRHQVELGLSGAEAEEADDGEAGQGSPRIVKTKSFDIKPMTPEEAALQMDVLGHDFYLFTNADTGVAAVVYRRNDGDVGLIDAS